MLASIMAGPRFHRGFDRVDADNSLWNEQHSFAGKTIDIPACYIGGAKEWGVYQRPGAFQAMSEACTMLQGKYLVPDAGHSVVEEKPGRVNEILSEFLSLTGGIVVG
jgi:pimeloyl-ACP methyl ester carboxylesterase